MKTFESVAQMKLSRLKAGQIIETKAYYGTSASDTQGSARYKVLTPAEYGATPDEFGDHTLANGNIAVLQGDGINIYGSQFGVVANGTFDDTLPIAACMDKAKNSPGSIVTLPEGDVTVSIASAPNPYACIRIPSNTTLRGAGKERTTITRPVTERDTDAVIICNDNHDTTDNTTIINYAAAENIIIEHLRVTDGPTTPNRVRGDLIALVHMTHAIVRNCDFGNHDQHCVDIAHSKDIYIYENTGDNQITSVTSTADYQMDHGNVYGATATQFINGAGCENVYIYNNEHVSLAADRQVEWKAGNHINTNVYKNRFELSGPGTICGMDNRTNQGLTNLNIERNHFVVNNFEGRAIQCLSNANNDFQNDRINVSHNYIKGSCRTAIQVGSTPNPLINYSASNCFNSYIIRNVIDLDWSGVISSENAIVLLTRHWLNSVVKDNDIRINIDGADLSGDLDMYRDDNNQKSEFIGNKLKTSGAPVSVGISRCLRGKIDFAFSIDEPRTINYSKNTLEADGFDYQLSVDTVTGVNNFTKMTGVISQNTITGTPNIGEIFTSVPLSDGTNNLRYVDFNAAGFTTLPLHNDYLEVTPNGDYQNIPLPGRVFAPPSDNTGLGQVSVMLEYARSEAGILTAKRAAEMQVISATQAAGVFLKSVDYNAGTFRLRVGDQGTSVDLDSSGKPNILTDGYVRAYVGI